MRLAERRRYGPTKGPTDRRTDRRTDGPTNRQMDGWTDGWTDPLMKMHLKIIQTEMFGENIYIRMVILIKLGYVGSQQFFFTQNWYFYQNLANLTIAPMSIVWAINHLTEGTYCRV